MTGLPLPVSLYCSQSPTSSHHFEAQTRQRLKQSNMASHTQINFQAGAATIAQPATSTPLAAGEAAPAEAISPATRAIFNAFAIVDAVDQGLMEESDELPARMQHPPQITRMNMTERGRALSAVTDLQVAQVLLSQQIAEQPRGEQLVITRSMRLLLKEAEEAVMRFSQFYYCGLYPHVEFGWAVEEFLNTCDVLIEADAANAKGSY